MKFVVLSALVVFLCAVSAQDAKKRVVCYFASWTTYRPGRGKFDISNIDASLCTHVIFGFIGLNDDASIHILDSWESDADGLNGFNNLIALKTNQPNLTVTVSMGGWNEGSQRYSQVAANATKRKILAENVLSFVREHGFDGFDLDWEYPGFRQGDPTIDKDDFTALVQELYNVLKPNGYSLTAAVAGSVDKIDIAYNVPVIMNLLDQLNVMVFDFHGSFENFVGHISPLYPAPVDFEFYDNSTWNVDGGIQHWLAKGADPEKLNMGVVTYGRSFTLSDPTNTSLYAPIRGGGIAGPYSQQTGILGYNEICEYHSNSTYVWDDDQQVPHRIWGDQWVGFEDERSVKIKAEYIIENGLGGAMVWSFDYDDFRGTCGDKYPLMTSLAKTLGIV